MRRALVTGCTSQQVGGTAGLKYDTISSLLATVLEASGFAVQHRKAEVTEDLSQFDLVVVGLAPLNSLNTLNIFSALWAVGEAERLGIPLAISIDDWAFKKLRGGYAGVLKDPASLTKPFFEFKKDFAWAKEHNDELIEVVLRLVDREWPKLLVPAFTWGDFDLLKKNLSWAPEQLYWDPSIVARKYDTVIPEERVRAWVLGALVENDRWLDKLGLEWDVKRFGKLPKEKGGKAERVMESVLVQAYADNRGVISIPYYHAGSGWWRNRYVYAASTRSIVLASNDDVRALGESFLLKPQDIERMSDGELDALAAAQAYEIESRYEPLESIVAKLSVLS